MKRKKTNNIFYKVRQWKITLVRHRGKYVWQREDGKQVSAIFSTIQSALYSAKTVPFKTHEEWELIPVSSIRLSSGTLTVTHGKVTCPKSQFKSLEGRFGVKLDS